MHIDFALPFFCLALVSHAQGRPHDWFRKFSVSAQEEASWLWGWGLGWAMDGSVSVVDRTPSVTYSARPASFGNELQDPLLGYVIPLSSFTAPCKGMNHTQHPFTPNPMQGCPELCIDGPHQPEQSESWIALVQRGGCPFVEKARQAQKLGAKAVVVGGDRESPDILLNMYSESDSSDVKIAATFIRYWDYAELITLIDSSNTSHQGLNTVSLLVSTEYSAWEWYSPIITFIVILLLPSLLTFITLLIHRVRAAQAAKRDRAPEEFVHRLPWRVWTGSGWEKHESPGPEDSSETPPPSAEQDMERGLVGPSSPHEEEGEPAWVEAQMECAICLEMFAKGDRVRVLPCKHFFHMDEVDEWLIQKKKLCPVCKADITQPPPRHTPSRTHSAQNALHSPDPMSTPQTLSTPSEPTERTPLLSAPPR